MNHDSSTPQTASAMSDKERLARNKEILLDALTHAGAFRACVTYQGGGDEGSDEGVSVFGADNASLELSGTVSLFFECYGQEDGQWKTAIVQQEQPLDAALCDYAMEAVNQHHSGWENNEGGYGEVVFECETGTVRIGHNDYVVKSDYTETVL